MEPIQKACVNCVQDKTCDFIAINFPEKTCFSVCEKCPLLSSCHDTTLACKSCSTPLQSILLLEKLGCIDCLIHLKQELIPLLHRMILNSLGEMLLYEDDVLHVGRGAKIEHSKAQQLSLLEHELEEAIRKEHFEQAAWIKTQIDRLLGEKC